MRQGVIAGVLYFSSVYVLGVALGALRTLYVVPSFGAGLAVAVELPIILAVAWQACRWLMVKCEVDSWQDRTSMAALAFTLLVSAEWLTRFVFNRWILGDAALAARDCRHNICRWAGIGGRNCFCDVASGYEDRQPAKDVAKASITVM